MSKLQGVYKRGNTWYAHMHWTDANGKVQQKKRGGFKTREEATKFRTSFLASIHDGSRRGTTKLRIGEYLVNEWLPNRESNLKPSTFSTYSNIVHSYLIPHVGNIRLEDMTARRAEKMFKELEAHGARGRSKSMSTALSAKTVSNIANVLNRAFRDAVRWDLIAQNPIAVSVKPSKRSKEMSAWEPHELGLFISVTSSERMSAIWHLAAVSGMRRGELLGLTWSDIDLDKRRMTIRNTRVRAGNATIYETPKSSKSRRTITLDETTIKVLKRWKITQAQERLAVGGLWPDAAGHVVTEADGSLPNPNTFSRRFKAICKHLGLRTIRLHDLRHSYVVAARRSGVDIKTISERLGHADINVTQSVYDHVFVQDDEAAANSIADHIYRSSAKEA